MGVNPHETFVQLWVSNEHGGDDQENGTSPAKRYQMAMGERERERDSRIYKYIYIYLVSYLFMCVCTPFT